MRLDLLEHRLGLALELVGERLDVVRAAERIDDVRNAGLVGEHLLRAERDLHRFFGRQRQRLVHRVGVQRLRAAEHRGERLVRDADDVVHRLLRGERDAGGLRVEAHDPRARTLRAVPLLEVARPDAARGAQLGDLLEEVVVDVPEERQPRREVVDVEPARDAALDVGEAVGERERQLLRGRRSGLANVVAGDRDRVPLRRVLGAPLEAVDDQSQRRLDREAPGVLRHVLLQDVVLNRAAQLVATTRPAARPRRCRTPRE